MADLKGAVRMTVEYSDGSKTVVNYNELGQGVSEERIVPQAEATPEVSEEVVEPAVEEVSEVAEEVKEEVQAD